MRAETVTSDNNQSRTTFLRLKQVLSRTGMSRSTLYAYVREGRFPAPVSISTRCVAWVEGEIDRWILERIAEHRLR
jgi:prophage regulatory protein